MTIRIWHTIQLTRDLAAGPLTSRDARNYMLVSALLYTGAVYGALASGAERNWMLFLELVMVLAISLIGVNECYKSNGGDDGRDFILRLSALSVPLGVKIWAAGILISQFNLHLLPVMLGQGTFRDPEQVHQYIGFILPLVLSFIFYWRLAVHIGATQRLSQQKRECGLTLARADPLRQTA